MQSSPRRHFQRARRDSEKSKRRRTILAAAEAHLRANGFDAFSMNVLAQKAGIAKGTLYLYFETREEVLLSLHAEHLAAWCDAVTRTTRKGMSDAAFVRRVFETAQADPLFLDLAARLGSVLEHNVSVERLVESKRMMRQVLLPLADHFEHCLGLAPGSGAKVLTALTALMLGAWQIDAGPPLEGDGIPADVTEMLELFSCRNVFATSALAVLAGIRAREKCAPAV
jgi:AcrR family transcriptional regulator